MHTAICTFENPADADRAVDRLLQAGFDRSDIHMEHRHADGSPIHGDETRGAGASGAAAGRHRLLGAGLHADHRARAGAHQAAVPGRVCGVRGERAVVRAAADAVRALLGDSVE